MKCKNITPAKPFQPITIEVVLETAEDVAELRKVLGKAAGAWALFRVVSDISDNQGLDRE